MSIELPGSVSRATGPGGLPLLHITNSYATVEVFLDGGHISGYGPAGHRDLLFLSRQSRLEQGGPLRGGIPLCGPWFGTGPQGNRTPNHGFFRNAVWELVSAVDDGDAAVVDLTLPASSLTGVPGAEDWPADARVDYRIRVAEALTAELTVTAGSTPLDVELALHTYLSVADVRRVEVTGLAGTDYLDRLDGATRHEGDGPLRISGETDRVYHSTATCVVDDPLLRRRITIAKAGSADTVVWNPWAQKATVLPNMAHDEWPMMLCVETASIGDNHIVLEPGASHTISATISAEHH